ncbi:MAG TPA: hypothetical protein VEA41_02190 [Salinarimonas sp.]|nr:hypothetical protein [Salinarimonas sp.]
MTRHEALVMYAGEMFDTLSAIVENHDKYDDVHYSWWETARALIAKIEGASE